MLKMLHKNPKEMLVSNDVCWMEHHKSRIT